VTVLKPAVDVLKQVRGQSLEFPPWRAFRRSSVRLRAAC